MVYLVTFIHDITRSGRGHCGRLVSRCQCLLILSMRSVFSVELSLFLKILIKNKRPLFDLYDGDFMLSIAVLVILEHAGERLPLSLRLMRRAGYSSLIGQMQPDWIQVC